MSITCKSINCSGMIDCSNLDLSLDNPNSHIKIGHSSRVANNGWSIGIGNYSTAIGNYSIAIGPSAEAVTPYSISIGSNAYASETYDIAIGGADSSAYAAKTDSSWNCVIGTSDPQFGTSNVKFKGKKNGYADIYCNRIICREILIDKSDTETGGVGETYNLLGNKLTASFTNPSNKQIYDPNNPLNSDKIVASIGYNDLITPSSRQFSIISHGNMYLRPGNDPMTAAPNSGNHVYAGGGATTTPPPNGPFDGTCNPVLTATWVDGSWDVLPNTTFQWWVNAAAEGQPESNWKLSRQSDHRIKQNLSSIPPADSLNKLSLTNPTSFNFKKDHNYSDDSLQHGFIAQELKEHFPEAVTVSTGYLPIDLSSVKVTYSDPSKTILSVVNLASYEINENTKLNITNPSGDTLVTITEFDNNTNSITLDKNIPDNFIRLRFLVDNFHYVQYDKFIPITISAIKKLKSTQDDVIESIKKLTQRIELLEENN
ncbi:MAG: hypothetical protein CMC93_03010 [Flavobacteriaceae bacterium]|nr:hypothetical protein [Flavobacteriaceae bacterium]